MRKNRQTSRCDAKHGSRLRTFVQCYQPHQEAEAKELLAIQKEDMANIELLVTALSRYSARKAAILAKQENLLKQRKRKRACTEKSSTPASRQRGKTRAESTENATRKSTKALAFREATAEEIPSDEEDFTTFV